MISQHASSRLMLTKGKGQVAFDISVLRLENGRNFHYHEQERHT